MGHMSLRRSHRCCSRHLAHLSNNISCGAGHQFLSYNNKMTSPKFLACILTSREQKITHPSVISKNMATNAADVATTTTTIVYEAKPESTLTYHDPGGMAGTTFVAVSIDSLRGWIAPCLFESGCVKGRVLVVATGTRTKHLHTQCHNSDTNRDRRL
jgi:hypothetical protein